MYALIHRFVKGERFFPAKVPVVNTLGIGPVAPIADGTKMSGLTQTRDEEGDEKSAESIPTFQARIVGQGYKQVCLCATLNHLFCVEPVHTSNFTS